MEPKAKAPRLQAYLEKTQGVSAFAVPRSQWRSLQVNSTQLIEIDVEATPMHGVASRGSLIAVVASQTSTGGGRVSIYRNDPKDSPTPVNVDHYSVWTDLASHSQIEEFAVAASTSVDPNLEQYPRRSRAHRPRGTRRRPLADSGPFLRDRRSPDRGKRSRLTGD